MVKKLIDSSQKQDKENVNDLNEVSSFELKKETKKHNYVNVFLRTIKIFWKEGSKDTKRRVLYSILLLLGAKIVGGIAPFSYKLIIDKADSPVDNVLYFGVTVAIWLVLSYGFLRIFEEILAAGRDILLVSARLDFINLLSSKTFLKIHELSIRYHINKQLGGFSRVIERGIQGIDSFSRHFFRNLLPIIIELIVIILVFGIYLSPSYMFVVLLMMASYIVATIIISVWRLKVLRATLGAENKLFTEIVDSMLNFEIVKYFSAEQIEYSRFKGSLSAYIKQNGILLRSLSFLNLTQGLIFWSGTLICILMVVRDINNGILTPGDFVLVFSFLMQVRSPLGILGFAYREMAEGLNKIGDMLDLNDEVPEVSDKVDAKPLAITKAKIVFDNVSFSYNSDRMILKNINFEIEGGAKVAIVGPSGSGKSTLVKLLYRFYDVDSGRILVDNQNISDVRQKELRSYISIVPQDTIMFNNTISFNISYGVIDATDEMIKKASRGAKIDEFIEKLELKYNTVVGERGLKLSGGEKQRIAIARVLLKGPPILVLDEATSSLDSETESLIQDALSSVSVGRTTLTIAHRLSTVVDSDKILVLNDGVIIESGTHKELIKKNGLYSTLWYQQKLEDDQL